MTTCGGNHNTDALREPMTVGQAVHRLHAALPREADFTVGRREWTHSGLDEDRLRCEPDRFRRDEDWCVTVQQATGDPATGYLHVVQGPDLERVVADAIACYEPWRQVRQQQQPPAGTKPPKLTAPGASERRQEGDQRQREVS
jgi:hypothetical protein